MKTITKIFIATCIGLLSVIGMFGGLYLHSLETADKNIELCALYMIVQGLVTAIVCIVYNFIHMWDEDEPKAETPKKDNLDNLEEVPVEEVN
jgi:hypothetical protein